MPSPARRAALVTGASSGIGLAIARVLVEEGHAVTLVARGEERLQETARSLGPLAVPVTADVSEEAEIARVVAAHRERHGRLDVLVCSAGNGMPRSVGRIPTDELDSQLTLNLRSVVLFLRDCRELLCAAGSEHGNALVVTLASIFAKRGAAGLSVYSAAKAGVVAFTQALNGELAESGVKATALCPALVDTPMVSGTKPLVEGDLILPEDVAESVRYLLRTSPRCVVPEIVFTSPADALWPSAAR